MLRSKTDSPNTFRNKICQHSGSFAALSARYHNSCHQTHTPSKRREFEKREQVLRTGYNVRTLEI